MPLPRAPRASDGRACQRLNHIDSLVNVFKCSDPLGVVPSSMPNWTSYSREPDGMIGLVDEMGGKIRLVETPSVTREMQAIDERNAKAAPPPAPAPPAPPPPQPMTPEAVPDGIAVAKSPTMTANYAMEPDTFTPSTPEPPQPASPAQPAAQPAAATPAQPAPIARTGGGPSASDKLKEAQANLLVQQALDELKGSPGVRVPGGTFPTGHTVQRQLGPDPNATLDREEKERQVGRIQNDLAYVDARHAQERGEIEGRREQDAAERQKKLEELQARQQEKLGGILGQIDTRRQEIADAKLDPNRLVKNMSTGQQALTGVLLFLGGFGKALSGESGPSQAMQVLDDAIKTDLEMQRWAVDQKRGDLNELGKIYQITKEQFGDEKMAIDAAYLAGLDIYKAAIEKSVAEHDAAMGVETQYDENGQIVSGPPFSMRAKLILAQNELEQARTREALSQAANGQVSEQFVTTQDRVVGARAPNKAKGSELLGKAAEVIGDGKAQQVTYEEPDGKGGKKQVKYDLPPWMEPGEGKKLRDDLGDIKVLKADIALLRKELTDHPIGSKTYNASVVKGLMERISSKGNVVLGQGAKNNDESARWNSILGGFTTNGVGAVDDMDRWADNIARNKLDQVNARAAGDRPTIALPQEVRDIAAGKMPKGSGGGAPSAGAPSGGSAPSGGARGQGAVRVSQAGPPQGPVARANGVRATPLDRAGASLVTATTAKSDKARAKATTDARQALTDSVNAGQLTPREHQVALQMLQAGDTDGLLEFLGRMRGTVSLSSPQSLDDYNRSVSNHIMTGEVRRAVLPNRPQ